MTGCRYALLMIGYVTFGFVAGLGAIDNDPIVKIICVLLLAIVTMGAVRETWRYLKR